MDAAKLEANGIASVFCGLKPGRLSSPSSGIPRDPSRFYAVIQRKALMLKRGFRVLGINEITGV